MIAVHSIYQLRAGQTFPLHDEESELLLKAQANNAHAFTELCRLHCGMIYATSIRMLANEDEAKDAVQETIIRAWEKLHTFRGECPFSAWLHRIAVNITLDYLRSRHRLTGTVEFSHEVDHYDVMHHTSSPELSIDLEEAISLLPTQARTVLVLHDIEGYKHNEISEMLGIAIGTSKAHLHQARTTLRKILES